MSHHVEDEVEHGGEGVDGGQGDLLLALLSLLLRLSLISRSLEDSRGRLLAPLPENLVEVVEVGVVVIVVVLEIEVKDLMVEVANLSENFSSSSLGLLLLLLGSCLLGSRILPPLLLLLLRFSPILSARCPATVFIVLKMSMSASLVGAIQILATPFRSHFSLWLFLSMWLSSPSACWKESQQRKQW